MYQEEQKTKPAMTEKTRESVKKITNKALQ